MRSTKSPFISSSDEAKESASPRPATGRVPEASPVPDTGEPRSAAAGAREEPLPPESGMPGPAASWDAEPKAPTLCSEDPSTPPPVMFLDNNLAAKLYHRLNILQHFVLLSVLSGVRQMPGRRATRPSLLRGNLAGHPRQTPVDRHGCEARGQNRLHSIDSGASEASRTSAFKKTPVQMHTLSIISGMR